MGKKKEDASPISIEGLEALPDWQDVSKACFINVEKNLIGEKKTFTLMVVRDRPMQILERPRFVPEETQPTMGFNNGHKENEQNWDYGYCPSSWGEIFSSLVENYKRFVFFVNPIHFEVIALSAMSTYFRDVFATTPFIDFFSPEYGCGKTTALQALIWSCHYGVLMDPSEAAFYRALDGCNSAMGLDEVDSMLDSEYAKDMLRLLNKGYKKGAKVYRVDVEISDIPRPFDIFGLKAFSRTEPIPESIISRSIQIVMTPNCGFAKLEDLETPEVFRPIRDQLYSKKLHEIEEVRTAYERVKEKKGALENRNWELFVPLLTMAVLCENQDPNLYQRILDYALFEAEQRVLLSRDERKVALIETLIRNGYSGKTKGTDIVTAFNAYLEEKGMTPKRPYGTRTVYTWLGSFDIKRTSRMGNAVAFDIDPKQITKWAKIYRLQEEDNGSLRELKGAVEGDGQLTLIENTASSPSLATAEPVEVSREIVAERVEKMHGLFRERFARFIEAAIGNDTEQSFSGLEVQIRLEKEKRWQKEDISNLIMDAMQAGHIHELKPDQYKLTEKGISLLIPKVPTVTSRRESAEQPMPEDNPAPQAENPIPIPFSQTPTQPEPNDSPALVVEPISGSPTCVATEICEERTLPVEETAKGAYLDKNDWEVREVNREIADTLVRRWHYSQSSSALSICSHGLFKKGDPTQLEHCMGVATWTVAMLGPAKALCPEDPQGVLHLSRLAIDPVMPQNTASFILGRAIKILKLNPKWKLLLTYADDWQGHEGKIYKATNWQYIGKTSPQPRWVHKETGELMSARCGNKDYTDEEMLAMGYELKGKFFMHKFIIDFRKDANRRTIATADLGEFLGQE